jgi:hypothetical protein
VQPGQSMQSVTLGHPRDRYQAVPGTGGATWVRS